MGDFMRNKKNKHLGIEMYPVLHYKLHYVSRYEGRSANGQVLYLVRRCISEFEKNVEPIEVPEELRGDAGEKQAD